MALSRGTRLDHYEILEPLGAGGMGEVYRASDSRIGRDVAIKVLPDVFATSPERLRRFEQEVRLTGTLNHPNIVAVHDVGSHAGVPFVVYELLEGQTLREWLDKERRAASRKAAELALQTARGLAAAHEKGVVHRDLKPENLFVTLDGRLKILDFGLAKRQDIPDAPPEAGGSPALSLLSTAVGLTHPGTRLGTVLYMSPEQVRGAAADHRSDIFSFGTVLYEMLSGRPAFRRTTAAETLVAILTDDPPDLPEPVSPPLRTLVWRCVEKSPAERFQSARDLAFALESVLAAVQSETPSSRSGPSVVPGLPRGRARRRPWLAAGAGGALAMAALAGWALVSHERNMAATAPRQVAPRQVTSGPGIEADPALSPDGSLVAFSAMGPNGAALKLRDVRGGPELGLTDGATADTLPAWFPDGSALAFVSSRDGPESIWKIHRLGGEPSRLLAGARDPAVSPDGRRLAFARSSASGHSRIGVAEVGRPETARLLTGDRDGDPLWDHRFPAWSPDGRSICYSDVLNLWIVSPEGGPARPLTRGNARDTHPAFAPDGRSVYFSSAREGTRAIWRVDVDGRSLQRITLGTGPESDPSVALTALRLAYTTHSSQPDLALIDRLSGEKIRVAGPGAVEAPVFLPDGRGVVYGLNRDDDWDLWEQPLDARGRPSGAPRRLTDEPGAEAVAAPTPDGRWLAYCRVLGGERTLWVVPTGGGAPRALLHDGSISIHPAWSPDGGRLAFVSDRDGREHLYVAPVRDATLVAEPTRLTAGDATDAFPAWSPDGQFIAFTREEGASSEAWLVGADGGALPRRLTSGAQAGSARFEPDGRALLVSGGWGGRALVLRRVPVRGGPPEPLPHAIELCDRNVPMLFNLSPDGRWVVFDERQSHGHVWVLEAKEGRF